MALSKLDAVNRVLEAIDEDPVSSLATGFDEAKRAEQKLEETKVTVLEQGWSFNRDAEYRLSPDMSNRIVVTDTMLRIDSSGRDAWRNVTVRTEGGNKRLYDRDAQTFSFSDAITCEVVWDVDWTALPHAAQVYIASRAAREYQETGLTSQVADVFHTRRESFAWTQFLDAEAENEDSNMITGNRHGRYIAGVGRERAHHRSS